MSKVVLIGATGAVGGEILGILAQRAFPLSSLKICAGERSVGRSIRFGEDAITIEPALPEVFQGADIAFMSAGADLSRQLAPSAVAQGCSVVDNSSAFRMHPDCPLVVPEVNGALLDTFNGPGIIANPNCSTIIALMAIAPLRALGRLTRVTACTYQAISGAGAPAMEELEQQAKAWAEGKKIPTAEIGRQAIFNCFSHESAVGEDGMNAEERKFQDETRRILDDEGVRVSATCVRVPVLRAHTEALHLEFDHTVDPEEAGSILADAVGLQVVADPQPIDASGGDEVLVGRIRRDHGIPEGRGLAMLVSGDQLRKGAALNAVQIAEHLTSTPRTHLTDVGDIPSQLP